MSSVNGKGSNGAVTGTFAVKAGLAQMLKGGVIMDVVTAEQARIAEEAGACAVMALERVPADIRKHGGNPFVDYQVPEAVIKLKQGFGRLIRTRTDTGMVAILDPRVRTKPYGRTFLASLPECTVVRDPA